MRALSIRQPFAELILRGIKTIEYRSRPTRVIGERFFIYASKGRGAKGKGQEKMWSKDLGGGDPSPWILEMANAVKLFPYELPTGVIVGSAVIEKVDCCELAVGGEKQGQLTTMYQWHLTEVERATELVKPRGHPQPVWFWA